MSNTGTSLPGGTAEINRHLPVKKQSMFVKVGDGCLYAIPPAMAKMNILEKQR